MKYYVCLFLLCVGFTKAIAQDNSSLLDYYQTQRFDLATDYLKKNNPEPITDLKILKALAYCSQMNGKLPEAEGYYERIYAIDSTSAAVLYSLGSINMRRGNDQKAETYFKQIAKRDSGNFAVFKQLAQINLNRKDIIGAINNLVHANKLNPTDADVAADLSDMFINLKAYDAAAKVLDTAIAADPENVVLIESLSKLDYNRKKWAETANYCEKLLALGEESGAVLTRLGIAYYNLNNYQCAIETLQQIDNSNQNETTCYYIGASFKKMKNYPNALIWFQRTVEEGISTNTSSYYNEIADTYEAQKVYSKAELAYQKSLQFKQSPLTYYSIANLYDAELKNHKMALLYYKKYLATKHEQDEKNYVAYAKSRVGLLAK